MFASVTSIHPPALAVPAIGQISLRPSAPADEAFLFNAYIASRDDEMAHVGWAAATKTAFLHSQFIAQQQHYLAHYDNAVCYVVQLGAQSVGVMWVARWPTEIRLMDMALLREFRNRGIGAYLLSDLIAEARREGKTIVLHTGEGNAASARFYTRHGFQRISSDGVYARMEWQPQSQSQRQSQSQSR